MPLPTPGARVDAVVFDLDDVLVPFHTKAAWQWAWHPQGPALGDRRTHAALKRSLHAWDRRRWQGLTGKQAPADRVALVEHLTETLRAIAGHALPSEEEAAVVRRLLRPAGEIERYPDVAPTLQRLAALDVRAATVTALPRETAEWLLHRAQLPEAMLLAADEPGRPVVPDRAAFRAAVERLGVEAAHVAYVGDLFWSDVRAAHRAGLVAFLLDRTDQFPHVASGRMRSLAELEATIANGPSSRAEDGGGAPDGTDGADGEPRTRGPAEESI